MICHIGHSDMSVNGYYNDCYQHVPLYKSRSKTLLTSTFLTGLHDYIPIKRSHEIPICTTTTTLPNKLCLLLTNFTIKSNPILEDYRARNALIQLPYLPIGVAFGDAIWRSRSRGER